MTEIFLIGMSLMQYDVQCLNDRNVASDHVIIINKNYSCKQNNN